MTDPMHRRSTNRTAILYAVALALTTLLPLGAAQARQSDYTQPIDVSADRSEFDEIAGVQSLIGNVEIRQGTIRIRADRITITLENNSLSRIDGVGSPIRFEQENDEGEPVVGEAGEIRYNAIDGTLVLSGTATLSQPRQTLRSSRIEFDSRTQTVRADGGDGGRVSIRIQPPAGSTAGADDDN